MVCHSEFVFCFFWREGVGGVVVSTEGLEGSGW